MVGEVFNPEPLHLFEIRLAHDIKWGIYFGRHFKELIFIWQYFLCLQQLETLCHTVNDNKIILVRAKLLYSNYAIMSQNRVVNIQKLKTCHNRNWTSSGWLRHFIRCRDHLLSRLGNTAVAWEWHTKRTFGSCTCPEYVKTYISTNVN